MACLSRTTFLNDANIRFVVNAWLLDDVTRVAALKKTLGDIEDWDMRRVTDLSDVLNCEGMSGAQRAGCLAFDRNIARWEVSSVTSLRNAFRGAKRFNQNIGRWRVGKVVGMTGAFQGAELFDQNLAAWSVTSAKDFTDTFNLVGGLSSCNRRALTDAPSWKDNAAFKASDYMNEWKNLQSCASWKFVAAEPLKRLRSGSEYHPYDNKNIVCVTNKPYKIAPLVADRSKTKVTNGEVRVPLQPSLFPAVPLALCLMLLPRPPTSTRALCTGYRAGEA